MATNDTTPQGTQFYPTWEEANRHRAHGQEVKMGKNGNRGIQYYVADKAGVRPVQFYPEDAVHPTNEQIDQWDAEYDRLHQIGMEASAETERRQAQAAELNEASARIDAQQLADVQALVIKGGTPLREEPIEAETMAKVTGSVGATFTKQRVDVEGNVVEESRESYGQTEPPAPHEDEWVDALLAPEPLDTWVVTVAPRGGLEWTTLEVWAHNRTEAINLGIEKGFGEFATKTTRTISGSSQTQVIVKVFGIEIATIDAGLKRKD